MRYLRMRMSREYGFTLLEIIVTIAVLSIVSMIVSAVITELVRAVVHFGQTMQACALASRELSAIRTMPYSDITTASFSPYPSGGAITGFDLTRTVSDFNTGNAQVKKVVILVSRHGSTDNLAKISTYAANVNFAQIAEETVCFDDFEGSSLDQENWDVFIEELPEDGHVGYNVSDSLFNATGISNIQWDCLTLSYKESIPENFEVEAKFFDFTRDKNSRKFIIVAGNTPLYHLFTSSENNIHRVYACRTPTPPKLRLVGNGENGSYSGTFAIYLDNITDTRGVLKYRNIDGIAHFYYNDVEFARDSAAEPHSFSRLLFDFRYGPSSCDYIRIKSFSEITLKSWEETTGHL